MKLRATAEPPRGDGSDGSGGFDIDALARALSAEAGRLRTESDLSSDEEGYLSDEFREPTPEEPPQREPVRQEPLRQEPSQQGSPQPQTPDVSMDEFVPSFGLGSAAREAGVFAEVGPGGLQPSDFELVQQMARLSVQQVTSDASAANALAAAASREEVETSAIVIFASRYYSGMPYQDPAPVYLKEYLPGTRSVAVNELGTVHFLMGGQLPAQKWLAAVSPLTNLPIVPLLGYFEAGISPAGASQVKDVRPGDAATLWLAFKWEGMQPLSMYAMAEQQVPTFFWLGQKGMSDRLKMLKAIMGGCVAALAYVHERGVAHGSLGSGSLLLSTLSDSRADQLVVKLDNFGFSHRASLPPGDGGEQPWPAQLSDDHPVIMGQKEDMGALAVTFLETIFTALAVESESPCAVPEEMVRPLGGKLAPEVNLAAICRDTSGEALGRLLFDVFGRDISAFRRYASQEPGWEGPVAFLDEQQEAGWQLLESLVQGSTRAVELLGSPFLEGT
eukprot:CAMPEP_0206150144 /NCGR_PEP_ID=MMETSP1473-20131121/38148_1 /ASSEMBLY_ACC=CAM_ASM_001109 /TAXON_ID=1461547 /ORGANISM="Stichococcus sp, Strain RCC1054" /LENGTH=502 /DNA_ID=CAMNT_0053547637 /DNA_START=817 /DNA_END=2325 /DNA_ORIENTATION=-